MIQDLFANQLADLDTNAVIDESTPVIVTKEYEDSNSN
jgi:hypothetical protein